MTEVKYFKHPIINHTSVHVLATSTRESCKIFNGYAAIWKDIPVSTQTLTMRQYEEIKKADVPDHIMDKFEQLPGFPDKRVTKDMKKCPQDEKMFVPVNPQQIYCCTECRIAFNKEKNK